MPLLGGMVILGLQKRGYIAHMIGFVTIGVG